MHISVVPLANCAANIKIKKDTTKFLARAYLPVYRGARWRYLKRALEIYICLTDLTFDNKKFRTLSAKNSYPTYEYSW